MVETAAGPLWAATRSGSECRRKRRRTRRCIHRAKRIHSALPLHSPRGAKASVQLTGQLMGCRFSRNISESSPASVAAWPSSSAWTQRSFVVLAIAGGSGIVIYLAMWIMVPNPPLDAA
jgi:hypothetical protein